MMTLGQTARRVREYHKLTQRAAAKALGISPVHLSNIECEKAQPSLDLLAIYRRTFNVDLYVLSWCCSGATDGLPAPIRRAAQVLEKAWTSELESAKPGLIKKSKDRHVESS